MIKLKKWTHSFMLVIMMAGMASVARAIPMNHSAALAAKVQKALGQDSELSEYNITVLTQHQAILLRGHVRSDWLLYKANALAKNAGAEKIINHIEVID
ncbi:MAG TPA: BON domain-containing protein [Burkholderiales bacterium]|nr:BON domain-containing protein [Burkholderiales bacterium]